MTYPSIPPFYQDYAVNFNKNVDVDVMENVHKKFESYAFIYGNVGSANADAKAFGYDTLAETLTLTFAEQGYASGAFSESLSATNGYSYYIA